MHLTLSALLLAAAAAITTLPATAASAAFTGRNLSGIYDCTGNDAREGKYTATVTLTLQASHSVGREGAYDLKMEVPGYGTYLGHVVADDGMAAIHFALTDPAPRDFGTGLARITTQGGKTRFHKFYYEPQFKGGNHGVEDCVRR